MTEQPPGSYESPDQQPGYGYGQQPPAPPGQGFPPAGYGPGQQPLPQYQQMPGYPMYGAYQVPPAVIAEAHTNRTRSNIAFGLMFLLVIGGFMLIDSELSRPLFIAAFIAWIAAWCFSVKSKGYSGVLGLLALFGPIGMIIMVVLPNKYKRRA